MKCNLKFTKLRFDDILSCLTEETKENLSPFDNVRNRVSIRTDILILPIQYLDDLNFTRNTEITQNYHITHESKSPSEGKKGYVLYHFRRRDHIVENNQKQEKIEKVPEIQEEKKVGNEEEIKM